ncbi:MAG TPA: tRNA epoxyqueuosine(34) reductase QueG [Chthoniobacteraceae bacterium]|nr:tRNA epoxyqueuosine(34) reductase QueG [Chthoniobacteraceae bacterium]
MSGYSVKDEFVSFAGQLGFDACRFAQCAPPEHAAEFRAWLEQGRAGEMGWLARNQDRRTDPQLVLPGARSYIALAMSYWPGPDPALETVGQTGKIARYAWGDDYHDVIERKLRELDAWLIAKGGTQKCYVDTGPVLERDVAAAAGIGWHGKSTMLISTELGAWFFLAEILTTLEFDPDKPLPDRCGKCTRCITACPTGAITTPHQLDARRCISYLTIESKGSIPEEFRPMIGDRIYGCDDCAAACPWNRFAQQSRESSFAAREFVTGWILRDYLALDDEAFRALFRRSPIKRIKRRGFLRNVCVALGNVGTVDDLPALQRCAEDPEALIAEHAKWAIGRIRERSGKSKPARP